MFNPSNSDSGWLFDCITRMYRKEIISFSSEREKRGQEPGITFNLSGICFALISLLVYKTLGTSARGRQHSWEA